jgi:hypothetical protein
LGRDAAGDLFYGHDPDPSDSTTVRCSADDGSTWKAYDSGIPSGLRAQSFVVNPADGRLFAVIRDEASNTASLYSTVNPVQ